MHEVAHHFGIDDDRLDELGWASAVTGRSSASYAAPHAVSARAAEPGEDVVLDVHPHWLFFAEPALASLGLLIVVVIAAAAGVSVLDLHRPHPASSWR